MKYKILNTIGKNFTPAAKQVLEQVGEVDYRSISNTEELFEIISAYNVLLVGLGLNIDQKIIDQCPDLKLIATATTGIDHINLEYAQKKGIEVISLKGETEFLRTITGTAELAFGLILNLVRYVSASFESVKRMEWNREKFRGHSLSGKTLGIVGLGRLGKMMAHYGKAFGMKVIAHDPYVSDEKFHECGAEKVSFDELLNQSDVVSIHVHLDGNTENMFNAIVFKKMKPSSCLINSSRGKIVNETDLLSALETKQIAGYAADVLADELHFVQSFSNHPLVEYAKTHDNCIIVPHIGGMTYESREATDIFIAKKVCNFFKLK